MTGQFKLIGFDLDGTLVDSLPDLALSVNSALAEFDLPQAPEALVLTWIGNGAQIFNCPRVRMGNGTIRQNLDGRSNCHIKGTF